MTAAARQKLWLVVNSASGSFDAALPDRLTAMLQDRDMVLDKVINAAESALPDAAMLEKAAVALLAVHTGDGTINAQVRALGDWRGEVLVLPGGTMNLLARSLHGEQDSDTALAAALHSTARRHQPVTIITADHCDADIYGLVGLFAGPTTAWGDVRETLRHLDIAGLVEAVPRAIDATFSGEQVRLAGSTTAYPAIYAEPIDGKLKLYGFRADGAAELFNHGFAWMGGDFRTGPHDALGYAPSVTIECAGDQIGLLVDGERGHCTGPLHLRASISPLRFVATAAKAAEDGAA